MCRAKNHDITSSPEIIDVLITRKQRQQDFRTQLFKTRERLAISDKVFDTDDPDMVTRIGNHDETYRSILTHVQLGSFTINFEYGGPDTDLGTFHCIYFPKSGHETRGSALIYQGHVCFSDDAGLMQPIQLQLNQKLTDEWSPKLNAKGSLKAGVLSGLVLKPS